MRFRSSAAIATHGIAGMPRQRGNSSGIALPERDMTTSPEYNPIKELLDLADRHFHEAERYRAALQLIYDTVPTGNLALLRTIAREALETE